jgi:hypothetical protein
MEPRSYSSLAFWAKERHVLLTAARDDRESNAASPSTEQDLREAIELAEEAQYVAIWTRIPDAA